jgi:hypothetical protein
MMTSSTMCSQIHSDKHKSLSIKRCPVKIPGNQSILICPPSSSPSLSLLYGFSLLDSPRQAQNKVHGKCSVGQPHLDTCTTWLIGRTYASKQLQYFWRGYGHIWWECFWSQRFSSLITRPPVISRVKRWGDPAEGRTSTLQLEHVLVRHFLGMPPLLVVSTSEVEWL